MCEGSKTRAGTGRAKCSSGVDDLHGPAVAAHCAPTCGDLKSPPIDVYVARKQWPSSSVWAIGTLVGLNRLVTSVTRLIFGLAGRRFIKQATI
jgi:hypothetical protein